MAEMDDLIESLNSLEKELDNLTFQNLDSKSFQSSSSSKSRLAKLEASTVNRTVDFVADVVEEIALEGLDGITLQGLWERLQRRPGFYIQITEESKNIVWQAARKSTKIQVYLLPNPRPDLLIFDREKYTDERGNVYEPLSLPDDIYPYDPVSIKKKGIRGSCSSFKTRKFVTHDVGKFSYAELHKKYGNRIVLVATQSCRESAILPRNIDTDLELTLVQYCIVERVARARYLGESTRGKFSMSVMKIDPKSLFYQRKLLIASNIIMKQPFSMKFGASRITSLISIFHIPRFYTPVETVATKNLKRVFVHLHALPNHRDESLNLRRKFGKHMLRSLLVDEFKDVFIQMDMPYAVLHPSTKAETGQRKVVKVVAITNPDVNIDNYLRAKVEEKEKDEVEQEQPPTDIDFFAPTTNVSVISMTYEIFRMIIMSGACGMTQKDISVGASVSNLDARTATRFLLKNKCIAAVIADMKKTKVYRYVWYKYKASNKIYQQLGSQEVKNATAPRPAVTATPSTSQPKIVKIKKDLVRINTNPPPTHENPIPEIDLSEEVPDNQKNKSSDMVMVPVPKPVNSGVLTQQFVSSLLSRGRPVILPAQSPGTSPVVKEASAGTTPVKPEPPIPKPVNVLKGPKDLKTSTKKRKRPQQKERGTTPTKKAKGSKKKSKEDYPEPELIDLTPESGNLKTPVEPTNTPRNLTNKEEVNTGTPSDSTMKQLVASGKQLHQKPTSVDLVETVGITPKPYPSKKKIHGYPQRTVDMTEKQVGSSPAKSPYKPEFFGDSSLFDKLITQLRNENNENEAVQISDPSGLHFNDSEILDVITGKGKEDETLVYETWGWQVIFETADINTKISHGHSVFSSVRNVERGNLVLQIIYKQSLVLGFQQVLRAVRKQEQISNPGEDVDRRSLLRIIKQLQIINKIKVWRLTVSSGTQNRTCGVFTPGPLKQNSILLNNAVEALIHSVVRGTKLTKEEKKQRMRKQMLLKKATAAPVLKRMKGTPKQKRGVDFRVKSKTRRRSPPPLNHPFDDESSTSKVKVSVPRKSICDSVDMDVRIRSKGKGRGDWTPPEDRYALCLFIASVLFIPRYNLEKVFVFNSAQIRDIMHKKLPESRNKSSQSVRRRLHFLMKNQSFYSRYRYYLNTALADKELRKEILVCSQPKEAVTKKFYVIPTDTLTNVFEYLLNLFSASTSKYRFDDLWCSEASGSGQPFSPPGALEDDFLTSDSEETLEEDGFYPPIGKDPHISRVFSNEDEEGNEGEISSDSSKPKLGDGVENDGQQTGIGVKSQKSGPLIVDGKQDPYDSLTIEVWTARTSILSLILVGESITHITNFLDSIPDNVLEYVVQRLRFLSVTTVTKPNNQFTISNLMKRKLQTFLTAKRYRQSFQVLTKLRSGIGFDCCTPELCYASQLVLPDFINMEEMDIEIGLPSSVVLVNEKWRELFDSRSSAQAVSQPSCSQAPSTNVNLEKIPPSEPPGSTSLNPPGNLSVDVQPQKRKADEDASIFENGKKPRLDQPPNNKAVPKEKPPHKLKKTTRFEAYIHQTKKSRLDEAKSAARALRAASDSLGHEAVRNILSRNEIFQGRKWKAGNEEVADNNSSTLKNLVLSSTSSNLIADESTLADYLPGEKPVNEFSLEYGDNPSLVNLGGNGSKSVDLALEGVDDTKDSDSSVDESISTSKKITAKIVDTVKTVMKKNGKDNKGRKGKTKNAEDEDVLEEGLPGEEEDDRDLCKKGRISNKMLRTLRSEINRGHASKIIEKDFFNVNLPKLTVRFDITGKVPVDQRKDLHRDYLQRHLMKIVPSSSIFATRDFDVDAKEEMGMFAELFEMVECSGDVGITIPYLLTKFKRDLVQRGLYYLTEHKFVYLVGVEYRRFVAFYYCQKWTMPVLAATKEKVSTERVIMRPWITSSGSINWPVTVQLFSTILGYLNEYLSIQVKNLCELANPMLSCVETMILVDALITMDFIKVNRLVFNNQGCSLFSSPSRMKRNTKLNKFLDLEFMFIELRPQSIPKFADLQQLIHPANSKEKEPDILVLDLEDDSNEPPPQPILPEDNPT